MRHDRLLALMNKGITLAGATQAHDAFSQAGILVHAYLMYGFPTQTERETREALEFVAAFRRRPHPSAYWHRFALTAHSPIARPPNARHPLLPPPAGTPLRPQRDPLQRNPRAPDHVRLGEGLRLALYNYMPHSASTSPSPLFDAARA
jgi:hypothetical protein